MVYKEESADDEKAKTTLESFEHFLEKEKVKHFVKTWKDKAKQEKNIDIKEAGINELLFWLWLLDDDEDKVLSKATNVLKRLLGFGDLHSKLPKLGSVSDLMSKIMK